MADTIRMSAAPTVDASALRARRRRREFIQQAIGHFILAGGGIIMLMPLVWLVSGSLKRPEEIFTFPPRWIPDPIRWQNYIEVFEVEPIALYTQNTLVIAFAATLGQVLTSSLAAFGFARCRFPGRDLLFSAILSTLMLPYVVTMIPTYVMFSKLRWVGTFLPLIVPFWFGGGAFNIFLLRQFLRTIPMELDEAAILDGANRLQIFAQIVLPLARPAVVVVTIFSFLNHWNDFLAPLIYLNRSRLWTLALGVSSLKDMGYGLDTTHLMLALSTMMVAPILVIYFLAQRVFIKGIALTGIKG
jgi:ABC-type glycerol-3-phosphate transport system permease component